MSILTCDNISYAIGVKEILSDVTFAVNPGAKVGVIGVNGAGKTTLFSIIRGALEPTGGAVYLQKDTEMGCLEQINDNKQFSKSIYKTALEAFDGLIAMEEQINVLNERIASGDESVINRFTELNEKYLREGGNEFRGKTAAILKKFGFAEEEFGSPAQYLSGGQKTKLLLARLLLRESDIILLDEPTNHLDIEAIEWLENFVRNSKKTFLIVSHDRFFLDRVTTDTLEIEHGKCRMHSGNYSAFKEKKRQLLEAQLKHYEQQQKEIKRIEAFIENQRRWNREKNIIAAESREKALARMVKIEKPKNAPKSVAFKIAGSSSSAQEVLSVRGLSKGYGGVSLFKDLSFELRHGNRLFVVGANGSGKSTLLKILTGREAADSGVFEPGYNQSIGYYDQEQQLLDLENTVLDEIWGVYADKTMSEVRGMLASFGFYGEDVFKQVSVLSGGERARLSIAKMISCGVSLLILDEPTNHLDIASKETLEEALKNYDGTVLAVSHDRYFIRALATQVLEIDKKGYPEGYTLFTGNYDRFLEKREKLSAEVAAEKQETAGKLSFEEAKKAKNRRRSAENRFAAVEKEIGTLEAQIKELKARQESDEAATDYTLLNKLYAQTEELEEKLWALYEEYEQLDRELNG
ncbi:MAG: ABC-F family ATP-binding cassette domain-containing protein [Clostridia bacterium]|nr:ABC-F family ATP-binding cassette domain-containing protein [Clostridia bacterium]